MGNGRGLELTDEERVKRYVRIRLISKNGFSEVDKRLKGWKKYVLGLKDRDVKKYKKQFNAVFNYFISGMSDIGDTTDDVLKANGNLGEDQKKSIYNDMLNDVAKNFVELCNGLEYDGLECRD